MLHTLSLVLVISISFSPFVSAFQECPTNQVHVQNSRSVISNGCSKPSFIKVDGEEDFTKCCDLHDACYEMCGSEKTYCDEDFKACMRKMCSTVYFQNGKCDSAADAYAIGTMMFGHSGHLASQESHCECIDSTDSVDHYKNLIEKFYRIHNPDKIDAVGPIVDKALSKQKSFSNGVVTKLYKLYYDLHKKYPAAIQHSKGSDEL